MPDPQRHRVFLSYARSDLDAALELRRLIEAELGEGTVWHDVRNLAGDHWWTEIEDAIRGQAAVEHVVLLASAEALARNVVRREWRLAWREGKTLSNVFWSARQGFTPPPLGEQQDFVKAKSMLDLSLPERWQALITRLKAPGQGPRRPFMPPAMPEGFVARPEEFTKLKAALLDAKGNAVAITAALRGAGGFGKTVLAQALAHDDDIQDAFHDGVLWVTLGERPSLIDKLADLLKTLTGEPQGFTEVSAAANKLREVLAERKCLIVIDDVWSESHLRPFTDGASLTARLVTTRRDDILPKGALRVPVDAMKEAEAVELLSQGLGEIGPAETMALHTLAKERLNEWPVIIRLVNGFLRKEVERGATSRDAIQQANDRLDRKRLTVFDHNDETARETAVEKTIRASIDYLVEEIGRGQDPKVYNGRRYDELAVFPEDVEVPIATIARLWARVAEVDEIDARDLLKHLYSLALLQALDLRRGTVRLHDVMRKYLTQKQAADALKALHHQFVEAYDAASGPDIVDVEERRYFYRWLPTHLHAAGENEVLDELLLDPQWMQRKLDALEGPMPLVADYESLVHDRTCLQGLIGRTLRLTSGILTRDPRQLLPQVYGRLMACISPAAPSFLDQVRRQLSVPAILTQRPSLTPPGAEIGRFDGHSEPVTSLTLLADGRLASNDQRTIRLWNIGNDTENFQIQITNLRQVAGEITSALCQLPDGRLASGDGERIRLWDLKTGAETGCLNGHTDTVRALAVLRDGHLASGGDDGSIRLWDTQNCKEISSVRGGLGGVRALSALSDGRLVSGAGRGTRIWDTTTGALHGSVELHSDIVRSLCLLPDGCIASGLDDGTIRIWDMRAGTETGRLEGHTGEVRALAVLNDRRLASGSFDGTIRIWATQTGKENARFDGHSEWVGALCQLPDGRLASGATDGLIHLWDITSGAATAKNSGHTDIVRALCMLPDDRVASGSDDGTIRIWDVNTGVETIGLDWQLERQSHSGGRARGAGMVRALCALSDGHLALIYEGVARSSDSPPPVGLVRHRVDRGEENGVSEFIDGRVADCFADHILVWDTKTSFGISPLNLGRRTASAFCQLSDGRLAASFGREILISDTRTGTKTTAIEGLSADITMICALQAGRLAISCDDGTITIWDERYGSKLRCLCEGSESMSILCMLPHDRLASGSDDGTIRIWDVNAGAEVINLEGHSRWVTSLVMLNERYLASSSTDRSVRMWNLSNGHEISRIELDHPAFCLGAYRQRLLVAGDMMGRLHWLEIVE